MIRLVIIESPYAGDIEANVEYAKRACLDSFGRGETPFASHLFAPQFLDDADEAERHAGISIGYHWGLAASWSALANAALFASPLVAFYVDRGWSPGMEQALKHYTELGLECEVRRIG